MLYKNIFHIKGKMMEIQSAILNNCRKIDEIYEWLQNPKNYTNKKIKIRFLMFPKLIDGIYKWLEKATWKEEIYSVNYNLSNGKITYEWKATKWLERGKK